MQPSEPAYPAFDTAQPTDAERIAALEAERGFWAGRSMPTSPAVTDATTRLLQTYSDYMNEA